MTTLRKPRARLWRDDSGAVLVTMALALTAVLGLVSAAVEVGSWYVVRRNLQSAADAAALAGALEHARSSPERITAAATQEAVRNGAAAGADTILVNSPPASGAFSGDPQAVEAIITHQQGRLFTALFGSGDVPITTRSVARLRSTGEACVLALDRAADGAVTAQGSAAIDTRGCVLAANSVSDTAIDLGGSSSVAADSLWTSGGITLGGSTNASFTRTPVSRAWALPDPYADLTISVPGGGCANNNTRIQNETRTLTPGVYCNGISVGAHGVAVLEPGTYYIDRGDFDVGAQGTVRCNCTAPHGVTIVLTSTTNTTQIGRVDINGGASVTLRAPSDPGYAYPGVLFFQDRRASASDESRLNGGATMSLNGALYFPAQAMQWNGNSFGGAQGCVRIIARTVSFSGNTALDDAGCAEQGVRPITTTSASLGE
ncbi:MAG TPA: pilus assembly protein TadG-related protein [Azospirillum sp.]